MNKNITCILPYAPIEELKSTIKTLKDSAMVEKIIVVAPEVVDVEGVDVLVAEGGIYATSTWKVLVKKSLGKYVAVYTKPMALVLGQNALERMSKACADTGAGMVYSDFYERKEGQLAAHPVIDYQEGSLRDDFDFGSLMFFKKEAFVKAINEMDADYKFAALYDVRLRVSQNYELFHLPELLYTEVELDTRKSGEKMFDYVDPRNRDRQVEMELACTAHLKKVGAYLKPDFKKIEFSESKFPVEASVIIPVRNREKTVADAIESVLKQRTNFAFNLIIVDNHSTDKTTEIIQSFKDDRIVHIIPERDDLGIGGCWNRGAEDERCGKFAVQLDSDDLYIDETVLEQVVKAFYEQNCAMVVGSYQMVNFKLEEIPPGLIDHKEWTPDNGRNNALRINGLGAPRAFYTPVLRDVKVPNTSYGEDYALGLNISRNYQIGRIYNPLYLCRRWEDNSDASLDINKMNVHNLYKDKIRTMELKARQQVVKRQKI
nr:glycosyltransferase family A protein [uncultured Carboxylicivirga sp.]